MGLWVFFVDLCPGAPEGLAGSSSGFKASQKTGHGFKSYPTAWEKPGIKPATPGLQGIAHINYNTAASRHRLPET